MRHRRSGRKLNRTTSHRKAMLANMVTSLVEHKKIKTTLAKAKEARSVIERLITFAKKGDLTARRQVLRTIRDKEIVKILFDEIAPQFDERNGGYTRIIKLGQRAGDGASLAYLELVGYEGVKKDKKKAKVKEKEPEKVAEPEPSEA